MALKFVFVVSCLLLLQSSGAMKLLARQKTPLLNRDCSAREELNLYFSLPQECRNAFDVVLDFTNAVSLLTKLVNPYHRILCSETCFPSVLEYVERCYATTDGLAELFSRGVCLFNMDGTLCFTAIYTSLVQSNSWQRQVRAECFVDFTHQVLADMYTTLTPTCSRACRKGLRQFNDKLGCCVNSFYNNTFVDELLPFAGYELWSNCGIISESPGSCSSAVVASALSTGIYSLIIITLGTVFL